ncbi:hypothetical protein ACFFRR_006952 [Megaselia abdita]
MLSTIIEIESPKNRSKESGAEDLEKTTELTIEEQQRLITVIQTLRETNKISQNDFASFSTYLKDLEEKTTFNNLIHSLKVGNCSIDSYNDSKIEPQDKNSGNNSDSFLNIISELNRRNICLNIPSSAESSSNSIPANSNIRKSTTEGCSNQTGGFSNQTESTNTNNIPDNQLNLREFLTKELEKRVNITPNSFDSISSSLMKSLFGSIAEKQKTSTPMYDTSTSSNDKTINDMFSISTVTVNSN